LGEEGYLDLRTAVDTLAFVNQELESKRTSIQRLKFMLFGPKTESTAVVCGKAQRPENASPSRPGESHPEPLTDPDLSLSTHPARATT